MDRIEKLGYFVIGSLFAFVLFAFFFVPVQAFTFDIFSDAEVADLQESSLLLTGEYFVDTSKKERQIHTYETVCKGYVVIDDTGLEVISTGYGDLADEYTYTITKEYANTATTSEPVIEVSLPDSPATTTNPDSGIINI